MSQTPNVYPGSPGPCLPDSPSLYGGGLLSHHLPAELMRLQALEAFADPVTHRTLEATGLQPGWRCLELGAGAGSIASWISERTAPGETVATDLDTSFLSAREEWRLTVERHDVMKDDFPPGSFDLVHARALLEHLHDREEAVARIRSWVRPQGWVCLEAVSVEMASLEPRHALRRCMAALGTLSSRRMGAAARWALELPHLMAQAGLTVAEVSCSPGTVGGSGNANTLVGLSLGQLAPALESEGLVTAEDISEAMGLLTSQEFYDVGLVLVSVRSRRR